MNKDLLTKTLALGASLILVALVAAAEYYGRPISFTIFYLLPIFIAVHNVGRIPGLIVAGLSGACAVYIDLTLNPVYALNENHVLYVHQIVGVWNGLALTSMFVIFALLVSSVEAALKREKRINQNLESLLTLSPADSRGWLAPSGTLPDFMQDKPATPDSNPDIEQTPAPDEGIKQP